MMTNEKDNAMPQTEIARLRSELAAEIRANNDLRNSEMAANEKAEELQLALEALRAGPDTLTQAGLRIVNTALQGFDSNLA
jgi:hypothetical protein